MLLLCARSTAHPCDAPRLVRHAPVARPQHAPEMQLAPCSIPINI